MLFFVVSFCFFKHSVIHGLKAADQMIQMAASIRDYIPIFFAIAGRLCATWRGVTEAWGGGSY